MKTRLVFFVLVILFCFNCRKKDHSVDPGSNSGTDTAIKKATVFTNVSDIRLAEIETNDGSIVTFFGLREANGKPKLLTGYRISSADDPSKADDISFDDNGRYSNIALRTGEEAHFSYEIPDSIKITISGPAGIEEEITERSNVGAPEKSLPQVTVNNSTEVFNQADKSLDVKITVIDKTTGTETDVPKGETSVTANFYANPQHDYYLMVPYNSAKGLYSLPLSLSGISYQETDDQSTIRATLSFLKEKLNIACAGTKSGDVQLDKSVPLIIKEVICLLGGPYSEAICLAAKGMVVICGVNQIANFLAKVNDAIVKIDPNAAPLTDATVTVTSKSYKYGGPVNSVPTTVTRILVNPGPYDVKITHEYTPPQPASLAGCPGFDVKGWWNGLDPSIQSALNQQVQSSGNVLPPEDQLVKLFGLTELDIRKRPIKGALVLPACFTRLQTILCDSTELEKIDVSALSTLSLLSCSFSKLTEIKINKQNLRYLWCTNNALKTLDIKDAGNLDQLDCSVNNLQDLDLTGVSNLTFLSCWENRIKSLNLSGLSKLNRLQCEQNWVLSDLNLSGCTNLYFLSCEWNNLKSLNLAGLNNLGGLFCHQNQLTSLDIAGFAKLQSMWCSYNKLTSLKASGLTSMKDFQCSDNQLGYDQLLQVMKDLPTGCKLDWGGCGTNAVSVSNGPDPNNSFAGSDCNKLQTFYLGKFP